MKAFLPLPSLEVILIPLILKQPEKWLLYALFGAIGTSLGGMIGYGISFYLGRPLLLKFASPKEIEMGEQLMKKYGYLAVFVGGVTPIPDFILAYLAGFSRMRLLPFIFIDGFARLLRSLLVGYGILSLGKVIDIERYGTLFSFIIIGYLIAKYAKRKFHKEVEL